MNAESNLPALASLEYIPYIDSDGYLPAESKGKIGAYAIFAGNKNLQFIGYSRDIYLSLKQHLVRQPQACAWLKFYTVERPSRTVLENLRAAWIAEAGEPSAEAASWSDPIDAKLKITPEEAAQLENATDEGAKAKLLKTVARRVEAEILAQLKAKGAREEIHFNPKLKELGLLDLK